MGVATLTGKVATPEEKRMAEKLILLEPGVPRSKINWKLLQLRARSLAVAPPFGSSRVAAFRFELAVPSGVVDELTARHPGITHLHVAVLCVLACWAMAQPACTDLAVAVGPPSLPSLSDQRPAACICSMVCAVQVSRALTAWPHMLGFMASA
jgi:hypothetical protein